jgi:hypothetical protein
MFFQHNKNLDFTLCEEFWRWRYTTISRVLKGAEKRLIDNHGRRLSNIDYFRVRFHIYDKALCNKIIENGDNVPEAARDCCGFIDRCSFRVGRPTV